MPLFDRSRRPPPSREDARRLVQESQALTQQGQDAEAITRAERALAIVHALLPPDDVGRVDALHTLGSALFIGRRAEDALGYFGEAVRILESCDATDDPRLASSHYLVAVICEQLGREDEAWPCVARWIELLRLAGGEDHEHFAANVYRLGRHYVATGQLQSLLALYTDNIAALETHLADDPPSLRLVLADHAFALEAGGRYAEGRTVAERLVEVTRATDGERSSPHVAALQRLASLCRAQRDHAAAQASNRAAIALCDGDAVLSARHLASSLWQLGESELEVGALDTAEGHLRQAIAQMRADPEAGDDLPGALNALATVHARSGHLGKAMEALEEAHALHATAHGERSLVCAQVLSDMATIHLRADQPASAAPLMESALAILREVAGESHPAYARALHDFGRILVDLGDKARARVALEESTALLRDSLGEAHPLVANHLQGLARVNRDEGRLAEAESQLVQALAIMRAALHRSHPDRRATLLDLATVRVDQGRVREAVDLLMEALEGELELLCQLFALSAEEERIRLLSAPSALHPLLTLVLRHFAHDAEVVRATYEQVLRRKGMGVEALGAQREAVYGAEHPALAESLRELLALRERIARAALAGPGTGDPAAHAQALAEWSAARDEREIALARDIPELALTERLRRADVAAVQGALPAGAVLVDYVHFDEVTLGVPGPSAGRLVAFVLPAGRGPLALRDLGASGSVDGLVGAARAGLTGRTEGSVELRAAVLDDDDGDAHDADGEALGLLRAAILDPLQDVVGGARRLFIAPDGALHRIPFEVLPLAAGGRLIDACTVSYLGAGRDALRLGAPRASHATAPMVIADPDYDLARDRSVPQAGPSSGTAPVDRHAHHRELQRSGLAFAPLPGTRVEGEVVAGLLGATTCMGRAAVESTLKGCRSPRILHIATHGFYLPEADAHVAAGGAAPGRGPHARLANPMLRSGLALAGANTWTAGGALPDDAEDALLNGEDVSGLDLMATELVVLSACESGLGALQAGEGVYGLRRAFVLAGAATLVVSLWPVPDRQTQELMSDFYHRLLAGTPRAEALRAAQLALKERHPDPRDWGAFICVGEPGVLAR